jgi:hypothetical protein
MSHDLFTHKMWPSRMHDPQDFGICTRLAAADDTSRSTRHDSEAESHVKSKAGKTMVNTVCRRPLLGAPHALTFGAKPERRGDESDALIRQRENPDCQSGFFPD